MKLVLNIEENLNKLLLQEDTDRDKKITIEDKGPKKLNIKTVNGKTVEISGTYFLSNLLQELILEKEQNKKIAIIDKYKIFEKPLDRINRMIKDYYWDGLTRKIDADGIKKILIDSKTETNNFYLYVPFKDDGAFEYFQKAVKDLKEINVLVVKVR